MIERLIAWSVHRRWWIIAAAAVWTAFGVWAVVQTPMDAVPDLSENQVLVYASWAGHGPEEIERQVTYPLSLAFQGLPGVSVVRGSSDVGMSTLYLIFEDDVSFEDARRRVQERLAGVSLRLPQGVAPRLAPDGIPTGQIFWYTVEGSGHDLGVLRSLQDWTIAPQLQTVPGIAEVASVGGFVREVHVQVDLAKLARAGLALDVVETAIADAFNRPGGSVLQRSNAEFVVQVQSPHSAPESAATPPGAAELEQLILPGTAGRVRLGDLARVAWGKAARRGMFEKDGNEVVGGVVHLRYGHNPLTVTQALRERLREIQGGLPPGVRILPCYDRTPLIRGAVGTVTRTLVEAVIVACLAVMLVLKHFRASLVIALTLPLVVLGAFSAMWVLRAAGIVDVQSNIMSLAGIVISIGVLVDSSIVMSENVVHELRRRYGDRPAGGATAAVVAGACQSVGRPVFFSVLIMLLSFLPVFTLRGIDGRMYAPLAWTKSLALVSAAVLAVTLVPALCAVLIRGRMRDETDSAIVRSVISVYRPILSSLMERPGPLVWILAATLILGVVPLGRESLLTTMLGIGLLLTWLTLRSVRGRVAAAVSLILLALVAEQHVRPLGMELRMPLNEGMVMDMPISVPRASITQAADDVKARDMVLCRFPEVQMVVGKAGRAETPFDPAPLDMIETMIELRPQELWPRRRLLRGDAAQHARAVWDALLAEELIKAPQDESAAVAIINEAVDAGLVRYDAVQRETGHLKIQDFRRTLASALGARLTSAVAEVLRRDGFLGRPLRSSDLAGLQNRLTPERVREMAVAPSAELVAELAPIVIDALHDEKLLRSDGGQPTDSGDAEELRPRETLRELSREDEAFVLDAVQREFDRRWREFVPELNAVLAARAGRLWTRIISEELINRSEVLDAALADTLNQAYAARYAAPPAAQHHTGTAGAEEERPMLGLSVLPIVPPHPEFDALQARLAAQFDRTADLIAHDPESLAGFGSEMDDALQMPGWTNVWTRPIQNRVDMLATGVNAEIGVRVQGRNLDDVVRASEEVAAAIRKLPGAADVVADPIRGKGYLRVTPDAARAAEMGVSLAELNQLLEAVLSGCVVAHQSLDREQLPVRVRILTDDELDGQTLSRLPVPRHFESPIDAESLPTAVTLDRVAEIEVAEGPATIKSENGWLRNYVRLNVRDRDPLAFVEEARRVVAAQVALPPGVTVEWTGQFEHSRRARQTLLILMPVVLALILLILYWTYRDWADALIVVLALPGALAGGVICQWLFGFPFSIAVGMGYIACFGMAAATGIVMLVYLREALDRGGGVEALTLPELRSAVLDGAVHRLRPKLLTEATTVLGLAPMLWSTGIGAEVIRPMAAPVLGGILIADEVIDLLVPVLFYHVRRRRWLRHQASLSRSARPETAAHNIPG
jgi:Cu(I)/Ag(I) efflux system membrane protein CusA/SilA